MGSADQTDARSFNGDFSEEGIAKLKETVKVKLKEFMGDYTDDTLVEYVIVLLINGRRKEEAKNELRIFLADNSEPFVAWLWDHLAESMDEYFSTHSEQTIIRSSMISSENEGEVSEKGRSDKAHGARHKRKWRSQPTNSPDIPLLLSSEVHKVCSYEKKDQKQSNDKRSPSSPQSESHGKIIRTDESWHEKGEEAKPDVSHRQLQYSTRDALAASKQPISLTEPSLKRIRSVVSASAQDPYDPKPYRKIRSAAMAVNPMASVLKAIAEAPEDDEHPKSRRSVFERISHSTGFSESPGQDMVHGEISPVNAERRSLGNNGSYVENMTTLYTGLQPNVLYVRSRLGSRIDVSSHPGTVLLDETNYPKSLEHRIVDPSRVNGTSYQNRYTEVTIMHKTAGFSGKNTVPDASLQRHMDGGRLVSSEAIVGNGNIRPATYVKEDSATKKPVPGTLSTIHRLEDSSFRTIFVANVHFGATKDSLSRHFNKFGEVAKVVIVTDPATGQPSGSAYIEFTRKEAAENALSLDGTSFMSRILKIAKGSNGQQQESASITTRPSAGAFTRASSYHRGGGSPFRGRSVVRGGARSMQWTRDSAETVSPGPRSLTYVRTEPKSDINATTK